MIEYIKLLYKKSKKEFYKDIDYILENKLKKMIITVNPETLIISNKDNEIKNILNSKYSLLTPDGIIVCKASKWLKCPVKERITGVDITSYLLKLANLNKYKVALVGAKEEVINKLKININKKYPNIKLVKCINGYDYDLDKELKNIANLKPDICLVALGIPKQEKLIYKHLDKFDHGLFIGVGGSFDVLSGMKKRAPKILIKFNLEWLYRIISEPRRIKRFIKYNLNFLFKIVFLVIKNK